MMYSDLIGKKILVGVCYYRKDQTLIEQKQYWGIVEEAGEQGIRILRSNGEQLRLPPDLRSTKPAPPGEYRLRSTGEIVADPDYLSTWNVVRGEPKAQQS